MPSGEVIEVDLGLFFRGTIEGFPESQALINVFEDEISCLLVYDGQSRLVAPLPNTSGTYVSFNEGQQERPPSAGCLADNLKLVERRQTARSAANPDNCVEMYLEITNDIFQDKGGAQQTSNYITGLFNQVIALYDAEDINMTINEINIWTQNDPYSGSPNNRLNAFKDRLDGDFDGNLAHLISYGNSGVAYIDVLGCQTKKYAVGYSAISSSYNNVPTYSWSVEVLTHEIGHNLGSPHTHDCAWNGNNTQIDDCGGYYLTNNNFDDDDDGTTDENDEAGPCYDPGDLTFPSDGTIMSYCHLMSAGIDLSLGFGTQPGNLIRDRVHNATCLNACGGSGLQENVWTGGAGNNNWGNAGNWSLGRIPNQEDHVKIMQSNLTITVYSNQTVRGTSFEIAQGVSFVMALGSKMDITLD